MKREAPTSCRRWWFITRKYPPAVGGMERLSFEVTTRIAKRRPTTIVALRAPQWTLPAFLLVAAARLTWGCVLRQVGLVHLGDPVLAPLAFVARAFGIPTVVTLHGLDVVHRSRAYALWRSMFLRGFARYVCISGATRQVARDAGLPAERLAVIGIGIDPGSDVTPRESRDANMLLFVGRLVRRKGVAWFVAEVLPTLATRHRDLHLAIIGDGPERPAVIASARSGGVAERLVWPEPRSNAAKAAWMARASLCVVPNVAMPGDIEGFGIVALEAAAAGCPVLAADVDGLPDAVAHGKAGTLLPSGDAKAWIDAIQARIADPAANERIGDDARRYVLASCGWEGVIDAYERLFASLAVGEAIHVRA